MNQAFSAIKEQLITTIIDKLEVDINELHMAVISAKESRASDTKSSAGDKFETGRSMMQMEIEKSESQLQRTLKMKHDVEEINYQCTYSKAEYGSLIKTNRGIYFISLPLGKINIEGIDVYVISMASPIGQAIFGKKEGDEFVFQNNSIFIEEIA